MAFDYFKLLEKIDPKQDAEDVVRLRKGVVDAVNADGTVDLQLSGVPTPIPDVPVLEGAIVFVGQVVRVATSRGALLVLGGSGPTTGGPPYYVGATTASSNFTTSDATVLQIDDVVFRAGLAYRIEFYGGWNDASGTPTLFNPKIKKTNSSGTLWIDYGWRSMLNGVAQIPGVGAVGIVRRTAGTDLTADVVLTAVTNTGTANMFANTTLVRWMEINPIGPAAKYVNAFEVT